MGGRKVLLVLFAWHSNHVINCCQALSWSLKCVCLNKIYLGALPEVLPTNDSTSFYLFRGYRAELWNDVKKRLYTAMARWRKSHSVTWIARWPWMPANSVCGSQPVVLPLVSCLWPTACLFVSLFPLSFPWPPVTLSLTASSHFLPRIILLSLQWKLKTVVAWREGPKNG